MKLRQTPPLHLTYCLNVHPGESWSENFAAIRDHALGVRDRVAAGRAFGLGLRLGSAAADELARPERLAELRELLDRESLYVFTINGFPYGRFHGTAVKQDVYRPDWRTAQRRDYTIRLADILAELLPEGVTGSISTVPGSYKTWITSDEDVRRMTTMLTATAARLSEIQGESGREIVLALEPEPDCYLETTAEAVRFLTGPLAAAGDEEIIRRHVGVCFDTSHLAVQFEDLSASARQLAAAGVRIAKVQLSSALRLTASSEGLVRLEKFCEETYLHQVAVRDAVGNIRHFPDLPDALADARARTAGNEWRVHFHVPLFFAGGEGIGSTSELLTGDFRAALAGGITDQLEIETYTWGVLPADLQPTDIADGIAAEYEWALANVLPS